MGEVLCPVAIPDSRVVRVLCGVVEPEILLQHAVQHGVVQDEERVIGGGSHVLDLPLPHGIRGSVDQVTNTSYEVDLEAVIQKLQQSVPASFARV